MYFNSRPEELPQSRAARGEDAQADAELIFADDITTVITGTPKARLIEKARQHFNRVKGALARYGLKFSENETMNLALSPQFLPRGVS